MDINATLIGQMITFIVFIAFTMKFVWPAITKAMDDREKTIADGLAAAEKGQRDLELAQHKSIEIIQEAKLEATRLIDQANKRANRIVGESKDDARIEGDRILERAQEEVEQLMIKTKAQLKDQTASIALDMAEKIIEHDIDQKTHQKLLDKMLAEI